MGEGWETQLRLEKGDVSGDRLAEHMPVLKRAMFPPDGASAVVAVAGAPVELKRAMFPPPTPSRHRNGQRVRGVESGDVPDRAGQVGTAVVVRKKASRRPGLAFPTACPPPLCCSWGSRPVDSPWKTLPAKLGAEFACHAPYSSRRPCRLSRRLSETPGDVPESVQFSVARNVQFSVAIEQTVPRRMKGAMLSTAPVPKNKQGAVVEGWETATPPLEWGGVPSTAPTNAPNPAYVGQHRPRV